MSGIFSTPKVVTPAVAKPTEMPDTDSPQVIAERRKALALAASRGGRQSTILSGGLGGATAMDRPASGDSYSASTLGGQ